MGAQLQQISQQQAAMGAQLQQISQQQAALSAALGARLDNGRRRGFNMRALTSEARALQPLVREAQQAEGGAAPGAAPPAGTFPATLQELHAVGASGALAWGSQWFVESSPGALSACSHADAVVPAPPASLQLSNGQLNALAEFYGEPFAGSTGACSGAAVGGWCAERGSRASAWL